MQGSSEPGEAERGCTGCDRMVPSTHFHVDKKGQWGLSSRFKDCKSDYYRLHYQEKLDRERGVPCDEPAEEPAAKKPRLEAEDL